MKYVIIVLLAASCNKQYTYTPKTTAAITSIIIDKNVYLSAQNSFSASGRPLTKWNWQVGALRTSGEKIMVLANPGVLPITLTVFDDQGDSAMVFNEINVK